METIPMVITLNSDAQIPLIARIGGLLEEHNSTIFPPSESL